MKTVHKIVRVSGICPALSGFDEEENTYRFLTNLNRNRLPLYMKAVETYEGPGEFAIGTEVYDANGRPIGSDYRAFYGRDYGDSTDKFWQHFDKLRKEFDHVA